MFYTKKIRAELEKLRSIASEYKSCRAECWPAEMMAELVVKDKRIEELKQHIQYALDYIEESPNKAEGFLQHALKKAKT